MMIKSFKGLSFIALFLISSCANLGGPKLNSHLELATLWVQHSAEYRALCYQAFNLATQRIRTMNAQSGSRPKAIVLDLDETVVGNSPYQGMMIFENKNYDSQTWEEWINLRRAQAVPGAIEFLKEAHARGFAIFYVSNRAIRHLDATYENMVNLGIPVEKSHMFLRTQSMGKDSRREHIAKNYDIVLLIGDVMTDFTDEFEERSTYERTFLADAYARKFGAEYIVLPNPMYGEWERALYDHDLSLTPEEMAVRRQRSLQRY